VKAAVATATTMALGVAVGWVGLRHEGLRAENSIELYRANSNFGLLQVVQRKNSPLRLYLND